MSSVSHYPAAPPFHPSELFADSPFEETQHEQNPVYSGVRDCFQLYPLDQDRIGTANWNPLGEFLHKGMSVLLKPNMVNQWHPRDPSGSTYVITHGSVVRAVADYVWKAIGPTGKIIVADAPETYASFDAVSTKMGLDSISSFYKSKGLDFRLIDLRNEEWIEREGVVVARRRIGGDPAGCVAFDLGSLSEFVGHHGSGRYYGADYDTDEVNYHHSDGRHEYMIAATAITCDAIISIPKLKTHRKAGVTCSLKNLVGVNGEKNWLPHHTEGDPSNGGDEHPQPDRIHRLERSLIPLVRWISLNIPLVGTWLHRKARNVGSKIFGATEEVIRGGNWWGNDTIWRMCLDPNKIILYGNSDGTLRSEEATSRKPHLVLVDAVVCGEGRGPTNPDPVNAELLVFGTHPASADAACTILMGFDPDRVPIVRQAFRCNRYPLAEWDWTAVELHSDKAEWNERSLAEIPRDTTFAFKPHYGWAGMIERSSE